MYNETSQLRAEMNLTLVSLRQAMEELRSLARMLERDPGSLLRGRSYQQGPNDKKRE